jgi:putative hydrolase of the HAD superfamily
MKELPILQRFDHLVLSHQLGMMKPDPVIFYEALRLAGTAPQRTAFFDDLPQYVQAAKQVGIRAYVFRTVEEFVADLASLGLR